MSSLLTIEGLTKSFFTPAGELRILKGINAEFGRGEMIGIVGASGVGKSTFLHILGTLDTPTQGRISYRTGNEDTDVDPFSLGGDELSYFRNRSIGFVFQFHYLLPEFSAIENIMMPGLIALGQKKASSDSSMPGFLDLSDRAERLLQELGIYSRKDHKPGELSGGEQQRVAVARALLMEPGIVFADEPTGNLDTATGEELFRLLLGINASRGTTFVIVTHNESLSSKCHRILEMKDGMLADRLVR